MVSLEWKAGRLTGRFRLVCPDETALSGRFDAASGEHLVSRFRDYLARPANQAQLAVRPTRPTDQVEPDLLAPLFVPAPPDPTTDMPPLTIIGVTTQPER
jgi:hypothetical protein